MRLQEEAQETEENMLRHARPIQDVPKLREVLREALGGFEESLKALSLDDREAALSFYLNKVRRITFGFHVAVLKLAARSELGKNPTREALQHIIEDNAEKMERITRLYRFL